MTSWHVDEELIDRFVGNDPLDQVTSASIEQHLATCASCQQSVSERTAPYLLDLVWSGVADGVDRSESGRLDWWLVRSGFEPRHARLLGATAGLRVATVVAVAFVVAVIVWASRVADAAGLFLALAPVVPTGLVAITFAVNADPAGECGLSTPGFGLPLLIRRALAVEVLALVVLGAGSLFVSLDGARAIAWLLPATALSAATVAAGSRLPTTHAAGALLAVWFGVLTIGEVIGDRDGRAPFADAAVFGVAGQLVLLALLAGSIVVVHSQRHTLFQEVSR